MFLFIFAVILIYYIFYSKHIHSKIYRPDKMMHNKSFNTIFIIATVVSVALAAPHKDEHDLKKVSITTSEDDKFFTKIQ